VTDEKHQVIYVNERLTQMLMTAQADIRKEVPDFDPYYLVGRGLDFVYHSNSDFKTTIEQLDGSCRQSLTIGNRYLSFAASPVRGPDDRRLGSVLQWQDETDERQLRQAIGSVVNAANAGDFSKRVETKGVEGTMADLAAGINHLAELVDGATTDLGQMLASLAKGDLTRRIHKNYEGSLAELKENANQTADQLGDVVAQIQMATGEVGNAAQEISSGTSDLSERTERAAANLEETAASTHELAATVKQNAENANEANALAAAASQAAEAGGSIVKRAVEAMTGIEGSAKEISDIIGVIDEIAFQTNLLALNASVEAARAGEAGKGFAVVAQEVRQLAQRSAQASSDIKVLIQSSNVQVNGGVQLVNETGEALGDIVEAINKATAIVRDIASASQEQANGVQEISRSIGSMDEMTQQNSALVEESTAAARALSDQSIKLKTLMAYFQTEGTDSQTSVEATSRASARASDNANVAA
ncbi:MAG: methyl-accepting chemotaxis protein, partial [Pseudomonadota bacterium]